MARIVDKGYQTREQYEVLKKNTNWTSIYFFLFFKSFFMSFNYKLNKDLSAVKTVSRERFLGHIRRREHAYGVGRRLYSRFLTFCYS